MCSENYHWHHDYVRLAWDSGFGFNLHRTKLNYDWSSIGLLDIDRVIRDRDVAAIEKHMMTVLNYSIDEEQTRILEPTFVKIFQLSQLSVQYLQFCKRYLDNTVVLLKKELVKYKEDNAELKDSVEELKNEIQNLKKKVKELKQSQIQSESIENVFPTSFKCNTCSKVFVTEAFLTSHIKRRHEVDANPFQTETDRLQLEIKELKERLNSTEKYIQGDHNTKSVLLEIQENIPNNDQAAKNAVHVNDLKDKFDHLKQYVERELTTLRDEKYYQEKYEKWFSMVFQRLDNSRKELQDKEDSKVNIISDTYEMVRKDSSTQTVAERCVESETMTDEIQCITSDERLESKPTEIDVQKIQSDIIINTESHLDQIQGVLEKKLSGGFEQIQSQMNTFWKKLGDIELEKQQSTTTQGQIYHNNMSSFPNLSQPQVKLRKKFPSPSLGSASSSESLETLPPARVQPKPAPRVTKIVPRIIQSKPKGSVSTSPIPTSNIKPKTIKILQKNNFSEDTSSDDSIEIVKPPVKVVSAKQTSKLDSKPVIMTIKSKSAPIPVKMQFKEDVEPSASETEELDTLSEEPQVKPSNTSTLGQRSLTSLKMITKDKDVMKGLKKELEEMVNLRLKEIGISPNWNGIPDRSYKQAIQVVKHQSDLSGKKLSNYWKAREIILKILNDRIRKRGKHDKQHYTEKKKKEKELVPRQSVIKKQTKQDKRPIAKTTEDTTYIVDVNSEDSNIKLNATKEIINKENIAITSSNTVQEKLTTILQTPIKKKVLFDLEDSSSASKTNINNMEVTQNQRTIIENSIITPKKQGIKEITVAKVSAQKLQKPPKIDDGGSTTSLVSSILEASTLKQINSADTKVQNLTKDDISDWDISDILT